MNLQEKTIARIMFQKKVLSASGQQFEDLFTQVLGYARSDFRGIKPQGKIGDRKNDGCEPKIGRYYQVYAPDDLSTRVSASVSKIKTDFSGLKSFWGTLYTVPIQEFLFVVNDRFKGAFPTTLATLAALQKEHGLKNADVFLCKNLEEVLFSELSDDQIQLIVGFIPDASLIAKIDYSILTEVVSHVLTNSPDKAVKAKLISPEFEEKLKFNALNAAAPWLKDASYQSSAVDAFFDNNVDFARQAVRQSLNDMYIDSTQQEFEDSNELTVQDKMYFHILSSATPTVANAKLAVTQNAVRVLLAYFFESCDIFEEPN